MSSVESWKSYIIQWYNLICYFLVPGDSSWVVLDSNGSSNSKEESQGTLQEDNIDIFSQAMASAEIDEFAANNSKLFGIFKIMWLCTVTCS